MNSLIKTPKKIKDPHPQKKKKVLKKRKRLKKIICILYYLNKKYKEKHGIDLFKEFKHLNKYTIKNKIHHQKDILNELNYFLRKEGFKETTLGSLRKDLEFLVQHKVISKRILVYKNKDDEYKDKLCIYRIFSISYKTINHLIPKTSLELLETELAKEKALERYRQAYKDRQKLIKKRKDLYKKYKQKLINKKNKFNKEKYELNKIDFNNIEFSKLENSKEKRKLRKLIKLKLNEIDNYITINLVNTNTKITSLIDKKYLIKLKKLSFLSLNPIKTYKNLLLNIKDNYFCILEENYALYEFMPYYLRSIKKYILKNNLHFMKKNANYKTDFYKIINKFIDKKRVNNIKPKLKEIVFSNKNYTKNPISIYIKSIYIYNDFRYELQNEYIISDIDKFFLRVFKEYLLKNKTHFMQKQASYKTDFYKLINKFEDTHTKKWNNIFYLKSIYKNQD